MKTALIALVALSSLGGVAHAQPIVVDASLVRTSHVQVADLNLGVAAGRSTAEQRIRGASAEVCANDGDRSIASLIAAHDCFRGAVDAGNKQLKAALSTF